MQRTMRSLTGVLLLGMILLAGCKRAGSEFVGKWVNTTNPSDTMNIERNGDQYLIEVGNQKIGATLKDETLQVQGMMGALTVTYVKSSDTLVVPGFLGQSEYKHAN